MRPRWWVVPLSIIVALMLVMVPLPRVAEPFRPDWVTMVVLYWAIALPPRFGLTIPWIAGLLLDVTRGALLGQNALGIVLVAAVAIREHQRLRVFPIAQQAVIVTALVCVKQALVLWISGMTGRAPENLWLYFAAPLLTLVFWPIVYVLMRDLRRRYQVAT